MKMELGFLPRGFFRRLLSIACVLFAVVSGARAQEPPVLYWGAGTELYGANADGSNAAVVFDGVPHSVGRIMDVAGTGTHIYFGDNRESQNVGAGGIWRADRDGGNPELFIPNDGSFRAVQFIALDEANNRIYFTCWYEGLFGADLDTGANLGFIARPGANMTGIAPDGGNHAYVVTGGGNRNLYRVNLMTGAFEVVGFTGLIGGEEFGLLYEPNGNLLYLIDHSGWLDVYEIDTDTQTGLLGDLASPTGLATNPARTHFAIVEFGSGRIRAYDRDSGDHFQVGGVSNANFGVALMAAPEPPPPPPPADLPIVETFNNGVPGETIADQETSDGKAVWRVSQLHSESTVNYGGEPGDVTYEPFAPHGPANIYLNADVDAVENYIIRFENLVLKGGDPFLDSEVQIGGRKTDGSYLGAYRFRQWRDSPSPGTVRFRWGIHYRTPDDEGSITPGNLEAQTVSQEEYDAGDYSGSEIVLSEVEIHVLGNEQRLFINGTARGPWYPTQGTFNDGTTDLALIVNTSSSAAGQTWMEPRFHGITLEELEGPPPPPQMPDPTNEWQLVDDFGGRELGPIALQGEWRQHAEGRAEVIENPYGDGRIVRVNGGVHAIPVNIPDGETGTVFFRARSTGRTDFSFGISHQLEPATVSGTAAAQFAFRTGGRNGIDIVEQGNAIRNLGDYESHTWYDIWAVIDNEQNFTRYYIQGGEFETQTLLEYIPDEGDPRSVFPFRHSQAGEALKSFAFQAFNPGLVFIDQIWFNGLEGDLTRPDGAGPIPFEEKHTGPLIAHEGFSYPEGDVVGREGGSGWAEPWRPDGAHVSPVVVSPGFSHEDLDVAGNRLRVQNVGGGSVGSVGFRYLDLGQIDPGLLNEFGHLGRPGTSAYLSFIGQGVEPITDLFWGISTFRVTSERLFVGKSSDINEGWRLVEAGTGNRIDSGVAFGEQSFFVIRLDFLEEPEGEVTARGYLFHNPDLAAGEPALEEAVIEIASEKTQDFNRIRVTGREEGFEIDEIRLGFTWESVTPAEADPPPGYAEWIAAQGVPEGQRGVDDDPDGDGVKNLLEFFLGGDPMVADRGVLPQHGTVDVSGELHLTLTIVRPADVTGVDYSVLAASEVGDFSGTAVLHGDPVEQDGWIVEVWRHPEPLDALSRGFLRLAVAVE